MTEADKLKTTIAMTAGGFLLGWTVFKAFMQSKTVQGK